MECRIIIDSDSRLNKDGAWKLLPHDKYGWNRFKGIIKDNILYYKGKSVIDLTDITRCDRGILTDEDGSTKYRWYYLYISNSLLTDDNKTYFKGHYLERTTLFFDGVAVTNAHVHLEIFI